MSENEELIETEIAEIKDRLNNLKELKPSLIVFNDFVRSIAEDSEKAAYLIEFLLNCIGFVPKRD